MSYRYMHVYIGFVKLRTYGGNGNDVRREVESYKDPSYVKSKHPSLTDDQIKAIRVEYH